MSSAFVIAVSIAIDAHAGQVDKAGKSYILHPLTVAMRCWPDKELAAIGVLHDVVEDTHVTLQDLVNAGLPERVVHGVDAMTRRKGESYNAYIERLSQNYDACLVKLHDIFHNKDLSRLPPEHLEWGKSMLTRYLKTEAKLERAIADHLAKTKS